MTESEHWRRRVKLVEARAAVATAFLEGRLDHLIASLFGHSDLKQVFGDAAKVGIARHLVDDPDADDQTRLRAREIIAEWER